MHKCKLTNQERIAAVKEYLDGHGSYATIARKYGIVRTTLREAVNLYLSQGEHALYTTSKNTHYSPELKRQAVEAYLSGEGSQQDICNRFHIWQRVYQGINLPHIISISILTGFRTIAHDIHRCPSHRYHHIFHCIKKHVIS